MVNQPPPLPEPHPRVAKPKPTDDVVHAANRNGKLTFINRRQSWIFRVWKRMIRELGFVGQRTSMSYLETMNIFIKITNLAITNTQKNIISVL